jgi:Fe2+ transport system protein B
MSTACDIDAARKQAERKGLAWVIGSFAFCPCHLPITLALVASLLSGTAIGAVVNGHLWIAGILITIVWALGTWRGFRYLSAAEQGRSSS